MTEADDAIAKRLEGLLTRVSKSGNARARMFYRLRDLDYLQKDDTGAALTETDASQHLDTVLNADSDERTQYLGAYLPYETEYREVSRKMGNMFVASAFGLALTIGIPFAYGKKQPPKLFETVPPLVFVGCGMIGSGLAIKRYFI